MSVIEGPISLVVTSFWEGFCLPAAEAMASGCPVIGIMPAANCRRYDYGGGYVGWFVVIQWIFIGCDP